MEQLRPARDADVVTELEVRRSRFITWLRRADDEDAARAVVAEARSAHPTARHHCSAFIVANPGGTDTERSSDDGEPAGTAGMPMLEVLRGAGLTDACAVVIRYFGGTKLGTGGLVRAYSDAVRSAVAEVPLVSAHELELWAVELPHTDAGRVEAELHAAGVTVHDVEYGATVTLTVATDDGEGLTARLAALTAGTARPLRVGTTVVERPHSDR